MIDEQGEDVKEETTGKDEKKPELEPAVYIPYEPTIYANMKLKDAQDNEVFTSDWVQS